MTTTTIYPIPGYPTVYLTIDGAQMTIRPMVPGDKDALLDFFRRASTAEAPWLQDMLHREGRTLGTRAILHEDNTLTLRWSADNSTRCLPCEGTLVG